MRLELAMLSCFRNTIISTKLLWVCDYIVAIYSTMHVAALKVGLPTARCCFNLASLGQGTRLQLLSSATYGGSQREEGERKDRERRTERDETEMCVTSI